MSNRKINPTEKMSLLITAIFMLGLGSAFLWTFHSVGSFKFPWEQASNPLPAHTVASRVSLGKEGERIQIDSLDPQLSKADCEKLANNYKPQAGQVSVHKPAKDGNMVPFCVDNLDGKGIFFPFDLLF